MNRLETTAAGAMPAVDETQKMLAECFVAATRAALSEMAGIDVVAGAVSRKAFHFAVGEIVAVVGLPTAAEGTLVVSIPEHSAAALARRILAGVAEEVDESLVR